MTSVPELAATVRELSKRIAQLEAAHDLAALRGMTADEAVLSEVASGLRIGMGALQGRGRDKETAHKRRLAAVQLRDSLGWTHERIAAVLRRSKRQVIRALK